MHLQGGVPGWKNPLVKMPAGALVKSVSDPSILVEAVNAWINAGKAKADLWTDFRYHDFEYPNFDSNPSWDELIALWRRNFRKFVDATYLSNYAYFIRLVEELNEYTDSRMVKGHPDYEPALLGPRLLSAQAAAWVWNNEYRGRLVQVDGVSVVIPADCRLVLCNSPMGNDIPKEFFVLAVQEDCVLGVHPYTKWVNGQRDPGDWRWLGGRWYFNEQEYGIKPTYAFTECSPCDGSTSNGWRSGSVMGGSEALLVEGMRAWWSDIISTDAYKEGRILGPGAWFTSKIPDKDEKWQYFLLWEQQLSLLADAAREIWVAPSPPVEPPPVEPPPVEGCRGDPRIDYRREYWVLHSSMELGEKREVFLQAQTKGNTVGQSWDDMGIGNLSQRYGVGWNVPVEDEQKFIDWKDEFYPGVSLSFRRLPFLAWPLEGQHQESFAAWAKLGAPRDYDFDGIQESMHEGLDFGAVIGQKVRACRDGVVVWASNQRRTGGDSLYGNHIIVEHDDDWVTWYCHLDKMFAKAGDKVLRLDILGLAGRTGNSDAPHLHLTVQHIGHGLSAYVVPDVVDPLPLLWV